jgi:hypothetical protein
MLPALQRNSIKKVVFIYKKIVCMRSLCERDLKKSIKKQVGQDWIDRFNTGSRVVFRVKILAKS